MLMILQSENGCLAFQRAAHYIVDLTPTIKTDTDLVEHNPPSRGRSRGARGFGVAQRLVRAVNAQLLNCIGWW